MVSSVLAHKQGRQAWLDLAVGLVWALLAGAYLTRLLQGRGWMEAGLVVYYSLVALAFVRRAPAQRTAPWWETATAVMAVFLPVVVLRPAAGGAVWLGGLVQIAALVLIVSALLSLGRSFAIAPADRGLITGGFYRWIRHPLYAFQLLFYVGFLMANPSLRNVLGVLAALALEVIRIRWEERILVGYGAYAARVRWRLVPFLW